MTTAPASVPVALFWFRRDLRLHDNVGLYHALNSGLPVVPVFIFDKNILDKLDGGPEARVEFIHKAITEMQEQLTALGSTLHVIYDKAENAWQHLVQHYHVKAVYTNHDYEPYAADRDGAVAKLVEKRGGTFHTFKDQVLLEREEVMTNAGSPFTIFTPYSKVWHNRLTEAVLASWPSEELQVNFFQQVALPIPSLADMGFAPDKVRFPKKSVSDELLAHYRERRDFPAIEGTSRLSVHLRFGTISIRQLARQAIAAGGNTYLNELCWRDFYFQVLFHFPRVAEYNFREGFNQLKWRHAEDDFAAWCEGRTGYAFVDAGMRQLNQTGWMHNRMRMVTASFLTKHLLIDWRLGEAYFAKKLIDYDMAANIGGWQWTAGTGTDSSPFFRIFNPMLQMAKFDPDLKFTRRYVPEMDSLTYRPIIDLNVGRERALKAFAEINKKITK